MMLHELVSSLCYLLSLFVGNVEQNTVLILFQNFLISFTLSDTNLIPDQFVINLFQ